jgi:hypothetical protein
MDFERKIVVKPEAAELFAIGDARRSRGLRLSTIVGMSSFVEARAYRRPSTEKRDVPSSGKPEIAWHAVLRTEFDRLSFRPVASRLRERITRTILSSPRRLCTIGARSLNEGNFSRAEPPSSRAIFAPSMSFL